MDPWILKTGITQRRTEMFSCTSFHDSRSLFQKIDALPSGPKWACELLDFAMKVVHWCFPKRDGGCPMRSSLHRHKNYSHPVIRAFSTVRILLADGGLSLGVGVP